MESAGQALLSAPEAARMLGVKYHAFLYWVRTNRYGIKDNSQKVGHNWVFNREYIESIKRVRVGL